MPASLKTLSLSFSRSDVGDEGARAVARRLPAALRNLSLNFDRSRLSEVGARAIVERLPAGLCSLSLNFAAFNGNLAECVRFLVQRLPADMCDLCVSYHNDHHDHNCVLRVTPKVSQLSQ